MGRKGYRTIALPDTLVDEIDKIIAKRKLGYVSRGEFVKEAVREKLSKLK